MEIIKIQSKRENCYCYYVPQSEQLYLVKNESLFLTCYIPKCRASGQIKDSKFIIYDTEKTHNHGSQKYQYYYLKFWAELKEEIKRGIKSNKIIFDEIYQRYRNNISPIIVSYSSVESTLRKLKNKSEDVFPTPHSVEDIIKYIPPNHELTSVTSLNSEQLLHVIPSSCHQAGQNIALFTNTALNSISSHSTMAFIDATYNYFPSIFYQLLIIHFEVQKHAFATIMVFMTRKTFEAYDDILRFLKARGVLLTSVMTDFEIALRKAIKENYPEVNLFGCQFHFGQAILRYVQVNKIKQNMGLIRKLSSLAFLPSHLIKDTYYELKSQYSDNDFIILFRYMERQWIKKPSLISVYGCEHNTNNISEAFNSYLKNYEGIFVNFTKNMNAWVVFDLLKTLYSKVVSQFEDYKEMNFALQLKSRQKNKVLQKKNVIKSLYKQLHIGAITSLEFVQIIYDSKFEEYLINEMAMRAEYRDENEEESEDESRVVISRCVICVEHKPIIGQFDCRHICLCKTCMEAIIENMERDQTNETLCCICRAVSSKPKQIFYA
ncbi:hypothetical protein PVAND_008018 [Polypedilum vanderplanki]|uniref:RING-type domain-containing protein n=1 Tax=Polypedilum vanderplanki TaxID=319348 RepID=A0A9J6C8S2_POLVA|nr:hypothetical protein PVAND_008018 [Polypedilum vanderplanki]